MHKLSLSGPYLDPECPAGSVPKLVDTLMVFQKDIADNKKNNNTETFPSMQRVKFLSGKAEIGVTQININKSHC